ncbi:hypothetical protein [Flavobacterium quisquiliarum]|uniref:Uncharacterized protein n=1 Tax=Flavobacterium quisquiliarum TaxID=1834436 RepID=A0ABV8W700_9FLAO|nr:hypothetical protein [Flavobacterium quisquiliarum]MBW1656211.1 hypothetical protein [Flavobacterium quisquiliarum]NWL02054.1 hypothetical protein [Flavobacterium collinsii]
MTNSKETMQNCKLCKTQIADKRNSHIIPKFMCKRLFENANPRHSIQVSKDGIQTKLQDIPKENHIFCSRCENRLGKIESYFSKVFTDVNSLQNARRKYKLENIQNQEILHCEDINPSMFYLFLYSLIWRCSISKDLLFDTFSIESNIEEEIRVFLNNNLQELHSDLLEHSRKIENIPNYYLCLIKPKYKTRGIFSAYNFGPNSYAIYTVDYALFFYTKEKDCPAEHKLFGNSMNETFKIIIGNDESWKELNNLVVQNMLDYKKPLVPAIEHK